MRIPVVHHRVRRRRARRRRVLWCGAELLVTAGVLGLLLVVHQMWWTNREAREGADRKVEALEREWGNGGDTTPGAEADSGGGLDGGLERNSGRVHRPGTVDGSAPPRPTPSRAYAILTIPRIHLRVPVAEGTSKRNVLDKGYAGHYTGTGQPGETGNFALAGHRNAHGEPFRHLDRLRPQDRIEVETSQAIHTYAVDEVLPRTSPRDTGVIRPVPRSTAGPAHGYDVPGRYLTLTTCTPEYSSKYRLVVWAKLVSTRARP